MKVIQVIPAFRLAGAEVMCENLCVALKNAGVDVIAVSLYSENTAITDRLDKKGVRIEYLDKKPGFYDYSKKKNRMSFILIFMRQNMLCRRQQLQVLRKRYIQSIVWLRRSRVLWERKSTLSCIDTVA